MHDRNSCSNSITERTFALTSAYGTQAHPLLLRSPSLRAAGMATPGGDSGVQVQQSLFGTMPDGRSVTRFDLSNDAGVQVSVITYVCAR